MCALVLLYQSQSPLCFILKEPDAKQRRRNRIQLLESKEWAVARPRGLVEAVTGGQSLAALLIYYCHQEFGFKGTCIYCT